jgi:hypothetical protein
MSLPNTILWGSLLPGGVAGETADGSLDTTQVIDGLLWTLHAGSRADLVFWTEGDLIQWMDEALKRLARVACVFVGRDESLVSISEQATYTLPDRHIATLHVSYTDLAAHAAPAPLRPSGTMELEALDEDYQTTRGIPQRWYEDLQGATTIGLAPVPDADDDPIPIIYVGYPDTLDAGRQNTLVAAPPPIKGYLAMCVLAEAYGRESEIESPDIAAHCRGRMAMYEQIFTAYYGAGM